MQALAAALRANTVGVFHLVAEGIADALAINAREDGAALAVGGTSGFGRLARLIAEAADVSDLLGYSPSDEAPTPSATKLSRLTSAPALLLRPALSSWVQMAAKR